MIKTISIIGGTGQLGSVFAEAFRNSGYNVIIASRSTEIKIEEAASKGDLVIVCVPIRVTQEIIEKISPYVRKDALLSDFTSVKVMPSNVMKKFFNGNIIACHPLFGPGVSLNNQKIVFCPIKGKEFVNEYKDLLTNIGLEVIEMTPKEHDKEMAIIQSMNHFSNIVFADSLKKENFNLKSKLATPAFKLKRALIGRMLSQDSSLYPDILVYNPYSKKFIKNYIKSANELKKLVSRKEKENIEKKVVELQSYFGSIAEESRDLTNKIINSL